VTQHRVDDGIDIGCNVTWSVQKPNVMGQSYGIIGKTANSCREKAKKVVSLPKNMD